MFLCRLPSPQLLLTRPPEKCTQEPRASQWGPTGGLTSRGGRKRASSPQSPPCQARRGTLVARPFPVGGAGFGRVRSETLLLGPQAYFPQWGGGGLHISLSQPGGQGLLRPHSPARLLLRLPDPVSPEPAARAGAGPCQPGLHGASGSQCTGLGYSRAGQGSNPWTLLAAHPSGS